VERLREMLDRNTQALTAAEPYFGPNFAAARIILDGARADNVGLHWASGAVAGPQGCTCGNTGCLHTVCWRIYSYAPAEA
jgi:hypothetical protein